MATRKTQAILTVVRKKSKERDNKGYDPNHWHWMESMVDWVESQGFEYLQEGVSASCYVNKKLRLVIKIAKNDFGINIPRKRIPKRLQPYWLKPIYHSKYFMIQPLAQTDKNIKAWLDIADRLKIDKNILADNYDIHNENTGFYRRKPIFFDWTDFT